MTVSTSIDSKVTDSKCSFKSTALWSLCPSSEDLLLSQQPLLLQWCLDLEFHLFLDLPLDPPRCSVVNGYWSLLIVRTLNLPSFWVILASLSFSHVCVSFGFILPSSILSYAHCPQPAKTLSPNLCHWDTDPDFFLPSFMTPHPFIAIICLSTFVPLICLSSNASGNPLFTLFQVSFTVICNITFTKPKHSPSRMPLHKTLVQCGTLISSSVNFMSFDHFLPPCPPLLLLSLWSVVPSLHIRL